MLNYMEIQMKYPPLLLDSKDLSILREIQSNADLTNAELAARVRLSPSLCLARVRALDNFETAMNRYSEVMECYLMTGDSDYLIRVVVEDVQALQRFIVQHLSKIKGVANIRSSFALKQVKYSTALPLRKQAADR